MSPPPAEQFAARVFLGPTLRAQPDRRLVDLVRDGYDAAFEEIVRRYRRPLDRFAAAIVGGRSEDVTQDAFSKALLALRGSEAEIELRPWLYRIVRNTALNDLRGRAPVAEELAETLPGGLSAAAVVEAREELRDLMERLGALPEPQRAALVMRELEGLSHEEIAAALGVSGGAARQAIFRARSALREDFGLLLPLPIVRALAAHGDDAARAGGALAGAGASSAGGAALGGIGAGALKTGMAAVLIAGTVGTGVAIDHHRGDRPGPEAAEAATLPRSGEDGAGSAAAGAGPGAVHHGSGDRHGGEGSGDDSGGEDRSGHGGGSGIDEGSRSGSDDVSGHSGSGSGGSGDGDRHGGSSPNSGPGSISGGHGSDDSGGGDHGGSTGSGSNSGSDDGGFDDHGGTSGGSGDGGSLESGGDSSGSGSGEVEPAPEPAPEPLIEDGGSSGSGSGSSGDSGFGGDGLETGSLDG
ncbi:MAG TPA: RNA polymerase sigma factor [Solirubrobacterales bacterium]|nr:RNA polymerase sigma factor [Solirubrobacterales bacterium]